MTAGQVARPYDVIKRGLDFVGAIACLIVSIPLQLVVAIFVRIKLGKPILFRQERPGRDGRVFTLFKFRSMTQVDVLRGQESDEQRLTPFGRWLRATSLDELPTLFNVIKGDMSFVGPRPLLVQYLKRYTPEQARRHEVRPGVTGLAQVNGRNAISWEEKFAFDVEYVERRSFLLDATILIRTLDAVISRSGISAPREATAPEFFGTGAESTPPGSDTN